MKFFVASQTEAPSREETLLQPVARRSAIWPRTREKSHTRGAKDMERSKLRRFAHLTFVVQRSLFTSLSLYSLLTLTLPCLVHRVHSLPTARPRAGLSLPIEGTTHASASQGASHLEGTHNPIVLHSVLSPEHHGLGLGNNGLRHKEHVKNTIVHCDHGSKASLCSMTGSCS